jgi:hypothetical protein
VFGKLLNGLSHELDWAFDDKWIDLGLNKQRACFFRCPSEFTGPYFFQKMRVCIGLITLAAYFPVIHKCMEYTCVLIKVDWLAGCIAQRVVGTLFVVFLWRWRTICTVLQEMGNKGEYLRNPAE